MTIDEVIQEYREEAEGEKKLQKRLIASNWSLMLKKDEQIADWLEELKILRQRKIEDFIKEFDEKTDYAVIDMSERGEYDQQIYSLEDVAKEMGFTKEGCK